MKVALAQSFCLSHSLSLCFFIAAHKSSFPPLSSDRSYEKWGFKFGQKAQQSANVQAAGVWGVLQDV